MLEVQDQVVIRVSFFQDLSPRLVDGHLLPASVCGLSSVRFSVLISSPYKDTSHIGL